MLQMVEYFTENINQLNKGQQQVVNLLKNQISLRMSAIKNFNEKVENLQIEEKSLRSLKKPLDK